jgi:hypothetical protein
MAAGAAARESTASPSADQSRDGASSSADDGSAPQQACSAEVTEHAPMWVTTKALMLLSQVRA